MPSRSPASVAARPDIQKWAWTTSGRVRPHCRSRSSANSPMYGSSSSFGIGTGGPASAWSTTTRRWKRTDRRSDGSSRRVCTTMSAPNLASPAASAATYTFWPPASTPPMSASGLACSETRWILMSDVLQETVPVGQESAEPVTREGMAARRVPELGGMVDVVEQVTDGRGEHVDVVRQHSAPWRDGIVRLRRRQTDHWHAEVHRLDERETERCPPVGMDVAPSPRELVVQAVLGEVLERSQ